MDHKAERGADVSGRSHCPSFVAMRFSYCHSLRRCAAWHAAPCCGKRASVQERLKTGRKLFCDVLCLARSERHVYKSGRLKNHRRGAAVLESLRVSVEADLIEIFQFRHEQSGSCCPQQCPKEKRFFITFCARSEAPGMSINLKELRNR